MNGTNAGGTSAVGNISGHRDGRRLIVISNRAPIRVVHENGHERIEPTVGGVGSTFLRLLEHHGGLWIAWSGGQKTPARLLLPAGDPRFALIFASLSERDVSNYYYGMCNRGLWPLMHYMISNCHFSAAYWKQYQNVNRLFAEMAAAEALPDDQVWVQDFHLALVPQMLRERRPELPIGIFWHVPFPPEQLFRILPWRGELLGGMLGADLIGFHTSAYVKHFLDCCEHVMGLAVNRESGEVTVDQRRVRVGAFPLGIPADFFAGLAASERVRERAGRIRRALRSQIVVLGVDRLDYTKGIIERLAGFERFLENNPAYHRRVALVLIAVPSRTKVADYALLKRQLDEQIGRVVGRFSSEGWVPIRYLYTQFNAEELVAYYQAADIALLTPLRDGMNLVAKEFVASHLSDDAVLILSEFAGAAEELTEALLVNPYDTDAVARRLRQAIEMDPAEKATRLRAMRAKIDDNDLEFWSAKFLRALGEAAAPPMESLAGVSVR
ncbi:MAG TPA: trehalose-6-phosphate synthase [Candidatus Binataceae bacterium]|nr:trehalose-6-phosphate synthase [Candidatus Binataceae bacterium]